MKLDGSLRSRGAVAARLVGALALAGAAACSAGGEASRPQRIVLVTLDTLRYDSSVDAVLMPNLTAFAKRGLAFENAYATASTTQPTHASLLTGAQPWEHGVTRNGVVLSDAHRTLAEILKERGYATRAVVASFPVHAMFGFAQGFDAFEDDFDEPYVMQWEGEATEGGTFFSLADSITRQAFEALDAAGDGDQFFWFHYFDPHDPYGDAPGGTKYPIQRLLQLAMAGDAAIDEALGEARRAYDHDVASMDEALGRLFARLAADEARFDTHVVVTADHGESFGEKGALGHGKRVTREQVQVPLVVVSPGVEARVRRDPASSVDVARTLLARVGVEVPDVRGRDLVTEERADAVVLGMRRTFAEPKPELLTDGRQRALPAKWFFVFDGRRLVAGNGEEALEEDDLGRVLEGEDAADARAMFAALEEVLERVEAGEEVLDEEVQESLRKLGYAR